MQKKRIVSITVVIATVLLMAFSPWMTRDIAEKRAVAVFQNRQQSIVDGCGLNCKGCGVVTSEKVLFGYMVRLEYACGLIPEDIEQYHQYKDMFVSFLGTVH